ncbi:MAG: hypothetical protein WDO15_11345 [Bacteroidota bacterium]
MDNALAEYWYNPTGSTGAASERGIKVTGQNNSLLYNYDIMCGVNFTGSHSCDVSVAGDLHLGVNVKDNTATPQLWTNKAPSSGVTTIRNRRQVGIAPINAIKIWWYE